jgi:hypothetical protein
LPSCSLPADARCTLHSNAASLERRSSAARFARCVQHPKPLDLGWLDKLIIPHWAETLGVRYSDLSFVWRVILFLPVVILMFTYYTLVFSLLVAVPAIAILIPLAFVVRNLQRLRHGKGPRTDAVVHIDESLLMFAEPTSPLLSASWAAWHAGSASLGSRPQAHSC